MTTESDVRVSIEQRIRLMSAVLSVTDFPEKAQARKRYFAHAHARGTTKYLTDKGMKNHPAVQALQALLDQNAPLEAMYTLVMHLDWPGLRIKAMPRWAPANWNVQLWEFYEKADLESYWQEESQPWEKAEIQSRAVFENVKFKAFLSPFVGEISEELVFVPNICYPADQEIGIRAKDQLLAITPPPQAWGDSPPLPYNEETMLTHAYRAALTQYGRILLTAYLRANAEKVAEASKKDLPVSDQFKALNPSWEEQFVALFVAAAVAMYLEDYVDEREAKAYMLMEKKARGMAILPGTVNVLRRYLQEYGNRFNELVEFLPVFPMQLRVAKKIVNL